jgi:tetratricopeptide (TPR) repeat protein
VSLSEFMSIAAAPAVRADAALRIGLLYFHLNDLAAAREWLRRATDTIDPTLRYVAFYIMGLSFDAERQFDRALEAFEASAKADPQGLSAARQRLVHLYLNDRRAEAALALDGAYSSFGALNPVKSTTPHLDFANLRDFSKMEMRFHQGRLQQLHVLVRP